MSSDFFNNQVPYRWKSVPFGLESIVLLCPAIARPWDFLVFRGVLTSWCSFVTGQTPFYMSRHPHDLVAGDAFTSW